MLHTKQRSRAMLCTITLCTHLTLYLIQSLAVSAVSHLGKLQTVYMVASLVTVPFVFLLPLYFYCRYSGYRPFKNEFSASQEKSKRRLDTAAIIEFSVAASAVITAVNVFGMLTDAVMSLFVEIPDASPPQNSVQFILIFIKVVLLAPVLEEMLFRGAIFHAFSDRSDTFKILLSASLFALMHYSLTALPYAFAAGLVISFFAVKKQSIKYGIALHLVSNLTSFIFSLLSSSIAPALYDTVANVAFWVFLAVSLTGGVQMVLSLREKSVTNVDEVQPASDFPTEIIFYAIFSFIMSILNI